MRFLPAFKDYPDEGMIVGRLLVGYPIIGGRHQQALTIRMFREGAPGSERAVNAKQVLGPEWQKEMEASSRGTC